MTDTIASRLAVELPPGLHGDAAGVARCAWCAASAPYRHYHDTEWGFPVTDERQLYENVCLEGFQAGLSWLTILNKRAAFRAGFAGFEMEQVARFGAAEIERLLADSGIVRHRGKIVATIHNAQRALELRAEFGALAAYFWRFEPPRASRPVRLDHAAWVALPASAQALALSRDLKRRGWKFVAPTTIYAFMQASGLVNDHLAGCVAQTAAAEARRVLRLPALQPL